MGGGSAGDAIIDEHSVKRSFKIELRCRCLIVVDYVCIILVDTIDDVSDEYSAPQAYRRGLREEACGRLPSRWKAQPQSDSYLAAPKVRAAADDANKHKRQGILSRHGLGLIEALKVGFVT